MIRRRAMGSAVLTLLLLSLPSSLPAQTSTPPTILNIARQEIIPGKAAAYVDLEGRIADSFDRAKVPAYWIESQSLTGPLGALYLNFFDSFADAQATGDALASATAAHPELGSMRDQLMGFTLNLRNAFAVRRDDLGYRADAIDFSKARVLRVATILVRRGYETEFAEAIKRLSAAYGVLRADTAWVTYQVTAGEPSSTFVIFLPMRSLEQMDDYINRISQLPAAEGPAVEARLKQIAREAYVSWDSELFVVTPAASHVSGDFAAGDAAFWRPAQK